MTNVDDEMELEHRMLVGRTKKSGEEIVKSLDPHMADILHMTIGIAGEAGELIDAIKKAAVYNKPLDLENVIEELGDIEYYMQGLREVLQITRYQTLRENVDKLNKRFPEGYTDQAAQARADKKSVRGAASGAGQGGVVIDGVEEIQ